MRNSRCDETRCVPTVKAAKCKPRPPYYKDMNEEDEDKAANKFPRDLCFCCYCLASIWFGFGIYGYGGRRSVSAFGQVKML